MNSFLKVQINKYDADSEGAVQQDNWCSSLKEFIRTAQNLALFRLPSKDLEMVCLAFIIWITVSLSLYLSFICRLLLISRREENMEAFGFY